MFNLKINKFAWNALEHPDFFHFIGHKINNAFSLKTLGVSSSLTLLSNMVRLASLSTY